MALIDPSHVIEPAPPSASWAPTGWQPKSQPLIDDAVVSLGLGLVADLQRVELLPARRVGPVRFERNAQLVAMRHSLA
jgi:hypothetical protein